VIVTEFTPEPAYPLCILPPESPTGARSHHRVHLTDVLRDMAQTAGIGKDNSDFTEEDMN
jgi:hypothetical protein